MINIASAFKSIFRFGGKACQSFQLSGMINEAATVPTANNVVDHQAGGVVIGGASAATELNGEDIKTGTTIDAFVTTDETVDDIVGSRGVGSETPAISGEASVPGTDVDDVEVVSTHGAEGDGGIGGVVIQMNPNYSVSNQSMGELIARPQTCHRPSTSSATRLVGVGYYTGTDPEAQNKDNHDGNQNAGLSALSQESITFCEGIKKTTACEAGMYLLTFLACFGTLYAAFGRGQK